MIGKRVMLVGLSLLLALGTLLSACAAPAPPPPPPPEEEKPPAPEEEELLPYQKEELPPPTMKRPRGIKITIQGFLAGCTNTLRASVYAEALRREYGDWDIKTYAVPKGAIDIIDARINRSEQFIMTLTTGPSDLAWDAKRHPEVENWKEATRFDLVWFSAFRDMHFLVRADTGLTSFKDMVDKKYPLRVGCVPTVQKWVFGKALEYYGVTWEEWESWGSEWVVVVSAAPPGSEMLRMGLVDALWCWSQAPNPYMVEASGVVDVRLLPLNPPDDPGFGEMFLEEVGLTPRVIPAEKYSFLEEDLPTVLNMEIVLVLPEKVEEGAVYHLLRGLWHQREFLRASGLGLDEATQPEAIAYFLKWGEAQWRGDEYKLHPEALRFYQEMGFME